jgi:uncharacterized protein YqeY
MINTIQSDLVQAMRDKNTNVLNVLRALKTAITNTALTKGNIDAEVAPAEIIGLVRKEISKRNDSIEAFKQANRGELIDKERLEIEILQRYLPIEWSGEELEKAIQDSIKELGATTKKDMGRVIKHVMDKANGKADNKRISSIVGSHLA